MNFASDNSYAAHPAVLTAMADANSGAVMGYGADPVTARLGREHNDANVLSMGARIVGIEVARASVRAFLDGEFQGGRHVPRIEKIARLEAEEAAVSSR